VSFAPADWFIPLPLDTTAPAVGGGSDGASGARLQADDVAVVKCEVDATTRVVQVRLRLRRGDIALDDAGALPPLPAPASGGEVSEGVLAAYARAGARAVLPDRGSRPWLLAQALVEEGAGGSADVAHTQTVKQTVGKAAAARSGKPSVSTAAPSAVGAAGELAEDRFLASDALSQHFLMQREADRKARAEKAATARPQPAVEGPVAATALPDGDISAPHTAATPAPPPTAGAGNAGAEADEGDFALL